MGILLAIDQGTTGTTAALFSSSSYELLAKVNHEYPQIYPHPGQVEHNLNEIWGTVESTVKEVLLKANRKAGDILSIGITNQRETICAFDRSGHPLANAIVWQDRRTAQRCQELREQGYAETVKSKTGLPIDPYFSATKIEWLLSNNPQVKTALAKNDLLFGTIDTYLLFRLTAGASHFTESSNASRTLLFNLADNRWDNDLLQLFSVPASTLPEVKDSFGQFGVTRGLSFLPDGIPITGILGDQQSALFGQAGVNRGDMKCTYGTGAFLLMNTGIDIPHSSHGLLSTVAYRHQGQSFFALEGSSYIAGAAVQWLRDNIQIIKSSRDVESLAKQIKNISEMENVLFLPFFTGIGSPHWKAEAKAAIIGLTRDTQNSHLARACLDGIAFSINDLIHAMSKDIGVKINALKVDGGAVENNLLMNIQATISDIEIVRPAIIETTALGAALASAVGANQLSLEEVSSIWRKDQSFFSVEAEQSFYKNKQQQWSEIIQRLYFS
jgi:glycerol kinase